MTAVAPRRVRIDLTPPQAVPHTRGLLFTPARDQRRSAVVLAPGAGTDLLHPVLLEVAKGLVEAGHPVLLFNFAFTEAGRKRPDHMSRLERAYVDVVAWLRRELADDRPVFVGGRSLGGRIASRVAADGLDVAGLVLLGYPLHPRRGRTEEPEEPALRSDHWDRLRVPALFVQGDRDAMCDLDLLERERAAHLGQVPTQVSTIAGGDHGFGVRVRDPRSSAELVEQVKQVVVAWVGERDRLPASP